MYALYAVISSSNPVVSAGRCITQNTELLTDHACNGVRDVCAVEQVLHYSVFHFRDSNECWSTRVLASRNLVW